MSNAMIVNETIIRKAYKAKDNDENNQRLQHCFQQLAQPIPYSLI